MALESKILIVLAVNILIGLFTGIYWYGQFNSYFEETFGQDYTDFRDGSGKLNNLSYEDGNDIVRFTENYGSRTVKLSFVFSLFIGSVIMGVYRLFKN